MARLSFGLILAALVGVLRLDATGPAVPHWPDDFTFVGTTRLSTTTSANDSFGSPLGDYSFGKGLAVHGEADGTVTIYAGSWNPQATLKWTTKPVDGQFSGNATFVRSLGVPISHGEIIGLYFDPDTNALFASFNNTYDADPATASTLSRNVIDPATGHWIRSGAWVFENRSDKMTQGGVTRVPEWWRTKYNQPNCTALAGFGGYWNVAATGPVSVGPAATCFKLPTDADANTVSPKWRNTPVLGYPFGERGWPAAERQDIDYWQVLGWGAKPQKVKAAPGWFAPGDQVWQGCSWVDTAAVSGLVCVPMLNEGCIWYGDNRTPPKSPVCNPTPGAKASINSSRQVPWVMIYDPADLGAVARRKKSQSAIQPVQQAKFEPPGITLPFPGQPDLNHMVIGVTYEPTLQLLAVMLRDTSTVSTRPSIYWFKVAGETRTPSARSLLSASTERPAD
jgi:hypothetical protein